MEIGGLDGLLLNIFVGNEVDITVEIGGSEGLYLIYVCIAFV